MEGYAVSSTTYTNHGCRCEGCLADHREKHRQWRKTASPAARRKLNKRGTNRIKRANAEIAAAAVNSNKPWTDEDKSIALNPRYTVREAAQILGRTVYAVKFLRSQHRAE